MNPDPNRIPARERREPMCDLFDRAWHAGREPRIENELVKVPEAEREAFFSDLLRIELEYRRQEAEPLQAEYVARFPNYLQAIAEAFERTSAARKSPPPASERFHTGMILCGRYRIVAKLGQGGMGEVFRADDLTLGQPVALKFLPRHIAHDMDRLTRFRNEAASARKVSHPNVCRVYDIATHEEQSFLTMEFIDGEYLASLLKRVGRLSEEKGIEIARELCTALAAVHDQGLLHRDLKPANVMLDGRGRVRLTDFELAAVAEDVGASEVRSGTPLYQAPEQLSGTEVTVRSDIYTLGLVLYELFTGRRAYADGRRVDSPSKPSGHVPGLNLAVERIILQCLQLDPAQRPRSVREVLAALPGGDPLAAALAAGETPSPKVVAEAGGEGNLSPRIGLALLGLAVVGILAAARLNDEVALFRQTLTERAPRELSGKARHHLNNLGYGGAALDSACGISTDEPLLRYLRQTRSDHLRSGGLRSGQPPVMYLWFRQSPHPLAQRLAANDTSGWSMPDRVLPNEPALREPGMKCVFIDLEGRLLEFHAVPARDVADVTLTEPDPKPLLEAAGFAEGSLRAVPETTWLPPVFADRRMAWEGMHPKAPDVPVHVEAAFHRGRAVYFHVGIPGQADRLPGFMPENPREHWQESKNMLLGLIALPIGGWFAWRNWNRRRANPFGATVLAASFVGLGMLGWLLSAKHVPVAADELSMFCGMLGRALFDGLLLWLAYLALEPWVRQKCPWRVISWNRLLEGKWADPFVGRDVLVGVAAAAIFVAMLLLLRLCPVWLGDPSDPRIVWDAAFTEGTGALLLTVQIALLVALRSFFLFFLVLLLCRREWLAASVNVLVWWLFYAHGGNNAIVVGLVGLLFALASLLVFVRGGLLGFLAFNITEQVLIYLPVSTDLSGWAAGVSMLSLLFVLSLAGYGYLAACRHASDLRE